MEAARPERHGWRSRRWWLAVVAPPILLAAGEVGAGPAGRAVRSLLGTSEHRDHGAAAVVATVLLALAVAGHAAQWRITTSRAKLAALRRCDGTRITLGVGSLYWVRDRTGILDLGPDSTAVILREPGWDVVRVRDIRWIRDAQTGKRIAGPW